MSEIEKEFTLQGTVSYWTVDRDNVLSLRGLFSLLQEGAIRHADQCGAGARGMEDRGESWVLNRIAVSVRRYPRYQEAYRLVTWSSGVRSFKGFRDFRLYCGEELVAQGSSLWLYISMASKAVIRVPSDVAASFPQKQECFAPDLERLKVTPPAGSAGRVAVGLRYSDFDANLHVNNTAYLDFLQTALAGLRLPVRPAGVRVQFLREIPAGSDSVDVVLEPREGGTAFGIGGPAGYYACGLLDPSN